MKEYPPTSKMRIKKELVDMCIKNRFEINMQFNEMTDKIRIDLSCGLGEQNYHKVGHILQGEKMYMVDHIIEDMIVRFDELIEKKINELVGA